MQKIGSEPKNEGQTNDYDEIPSIQRIPLTPTQAALYVSARMIDTCIREYDTGNDNARVYCDMRV